MGEPLHVAEPRRQQAERGAPPGGASRAALAARVVIAPLLLWIVVALGAAVGGASLVAAWRAAAPLMLAVLLAAAAAAELVQIRVTEAGEERLSLSFTIAVVLAAVVAQPVAAPLVSLTGALVHVLRRRQRPTSKALFNLANPALAAGIATATHVWLRPLLPPGDAGRLAAALAATLVFGAANALPIALMISLHSGRPVVAVLRGAAWASPASLLLGVTGAYLGGAYATLGLVGVSLFVGPALLLRFMLVAYARQSQRTIAALTAAKAAVEAAEARYRGVFAGAADGLIVVDDAGRCLEANPAALALLGRPLAEVRGAALADLLLPAGTAVAARPRLGAEGQGAGEIQRPDGQTAPVEWHTALVDLPSGRASIVLIHDITERLAGERMRHEFAAMAGHELRTPITTIMGLAQFLRRTGRYDAQAAETIARQATHLTRLVGDLLDVSHLESGRLDIRPRPTELVALVRGVTGLGHGASDRHRARVEAPAGPLLVVADRDRISQVLTNLLANAVKYWPAGGEIVVRVDRREAEALVSVSDQGEGIAPEAQARIFEPYYRSEAAIASQVKGLGLGLYISRRFVEAHGGRLWVESTPGMGSTFTFTLPLAPTDAPAEGEAPGNPG